MRDDIPPPPPRQELTNPPQPPANSRRGYDSPYDYVPTATDKNITDLMKYKAAAQYWQGIATKAEKAQERAEGELAIQRREHRIERFVCWGLVAFVVLMLMIPILFLANRVPSGPPPAPRFYIELLFHIIMGGFHA